MFGSGKKALAVAERAASQADQATERAADAERVGAATQNLVAELGDRNDLPQERHQQAILTDFQDAVRTNDQAEQVLRDAERTAAQAALALVEARKRMRRVTDGVV